MNVSKVMNILDAICTETMNCQLKGEMIKNNYSWNGWRSIFFAHVRPF